MPPLINNSNGSHGILDREAPITTSPQAIALDELIPSRPSHLQEQNLTHSAEAELPSNTNNSFATHPVLATKDEVKVNDTFLIHNTTSDGSPPSNTSSYMWDDTSFNRTRTSVAILVAIGVSPSTLILCLSTVGLVLGASRMAQPSPAVELFPPLIYLPVLTAVFFPH